jgi:hypothetical protein
MADLDDFLMISLPPKLGAHIHLIDEVHSLVPIPNEIFLPMHGHGFPWGVFRVLLPAWWHVWSEPKKLIQTFVEGRPMEGTKSMNQEHANQANRMVNALA